MSGSTFNDDSDELSERIRNQFQDRGYFKAEVEKLNIKVIDPLAAPKPIRMEAQVSEGGRDCPPSPSPVTTRSVPRNCEPIS